MAAQLLDFGSITDIPIAVGGHSCRYEPLVPPKMTYDGVLHSQVTAYRGFVRVWSLRTPMMDIADAEALYAELRQSGGQVANGALVGTSIKCHPGAVSLVFDPEYEDEAAVSFELRQSVSVTGQDRQELVRVWVANASDTLVDLTAYFIGGTITKDIEQFCKRANLQFMRESSAGSIAPLVASPEPIDEARRVKVEMAVIALGATPSSSDWWVEFEGKTDSISWGGNDPVMTAECRDNGAEIVDRFMDGTSSHGNAGGTATSQSVLQDLLDTWLVSPPTLLTVGTPSQGVFTADFGNASLHDAGQSVVDLNGWDWRYLWHDASGAERLTYYEPPRSKTTPDWTVDESDYFELTEVSRSRRAIRNHAAVKVSASTTYYADDLTSQGTYGYRPIILDESQNPQITTQAQAEAFGAYVLSDTAFPRLSHAARMALRQINLNDLGRFTANNVHYSTDQDVAIVSVTTTLSPTGNYMEVSGTVKPRGPTLRWHKKEMVQRAAREVQGVAGTIEPNTDTVVPEVAVKLAMSGTTGTVTLVLSDSAGFIDAVSFESFDSTSDFDTDSDPTTWSGYDNTVPFTLSFAATAAEGFPTYIAYAYRRDLGSGAEWIRGVVPLPPGGLPSASFGVGVIGASVWLSWAGNPVFKSLRWAGSTSVMPSSGDVASGAVLPGRSSDGSEIKNDLAAGEAFYLRVRGFTDGSGGGTASAVDFRIRVERPATSGPPELYVTTSQSGGTGNLTMVLIDPDGLVNATSSETKSGGGDHDFTGDPSTWSGFDNSAPYSLTRSVTIVPKHMSKIAAGVRFDDGSGNQWITRERTFDADREANAYTPGIGFDDAGYLLLSLAGDEDSRGVVAGYALDSDPSTPVAGASTTLTAGAIAGGSALTVSSATGFTVGNYAVLYDGTNGELVYIRAAAGTTVSVQTTGVANDYGVGATLTEISNTGGEGLGAGVFAQSGSVKTVLSTSVGPNDTTQVNIGQEVRVVARAVGPAGLGPATGVIRRRRGDTEHIKPGVKVTATRSGSSVSVALTIHDPSFAITANPSYKRRDGSDQTWDASWQTSWTSSTGTAGTAQTLSRAVTLADPYVAFSWRVQYTDENGDAQEIGDDLDLASVQEIAKELVIGPADWVASANTVTYGIEDPTSFNGHNLTPGTAGVTSTFYHYPRFPDGVDLTNIQAGIVESGSAAGVLILYRGTTALATLTSTTGASLSHTVDWATYKYVMKLTLNDGGTPGNMLMGATTIDYNMPSFVQSY